MWTAILTKDALDPRSSSAVKPNSIMLKKPLASVIFITYNQEELVEESIKSILEQTYSPLEIVISDDFSNDKTTQKILEVTSKYEGPHLIKYCFNTQNLGLCGNINQAIKNCSGEFIFAAAGDDISLPGRCEKVMQEWLRLEKKPGLIATDAFDMTLEGEILGIKRTSILQTYSGIRDWIHKPPYFFGSSHSWSKKFLDKFPPLNKQLFAEDHLMIFRAIISDGAYAVSEPLVKHRQGGITKKKYLGLIEKINKLKAGFPDKYVLLQQMLEDAKFLEDLPLLQKYFKKELIECELALNLFNTKETHLKIVRCCKFDGISFFFKIRLLTYTTFPQILMPVFWLKKLKKKYR
jgi:glycosyltransferase involved in cell wall biosynthesis